MASEKTINTLKFNQLSDSTYKTITPNEGEFYITEEELKTVDVVIEKYSDGLNWYRVWSDGWIEQGGVVPVNVSTVDTATAVSVTYLKQFTTTAYPLVSIKSGWVYNSKGGPEEVSTTGWSGFVMSDHVQVVYVVWSACGY
jgi:hypothetical protein